MNSGGVKAGVRERAVLEAKYGMLFISKIHLQRRTRNQVPRLPLYRFVLRK